MTWTTEWLKACAAVEDDLAAENRRCPRCGHRLVVGYSRLGLPLPACPSCDPYTVGRTIAEVRAHAAEWGIR